VYSTLLVLQDWISKISVRDVTKNVRDVTWLHGHQKLWLYSPGSSNMTVSEYLLERIISCLLPANLLSKIS